MNNRIQELIQQSMVEHQFDTRFSPEKFAELIVKECYLWAKENGGLGCDEDFEALKQHLGVENDIDQSSSALR
jgi:hypothetical protein